MLELREVSYRYPGAEADVVCGMSLAVVPGEHVCLVGANGSGKSTVERIACGAIAPSWGHVLIDGEEVVEPGCGGAVAVVGQDPREQMTSALVEEEVAFGPRCQLLSEQEVHERVVEALEACRIDGLINRVVSELSGGQMQLVALAGALAVRPRYLVLDEVTSHLDKQSREQLGNVLARLREEGIGILEVTHDIRQVRQADRVVEMAEGRTVWEGTPSDWERRHEAKLEALAHGRERLLGDLGFAAQQPECALAMRDVWVSYGDHLVLEGLSVAARSGELVLLCGPSGSGKTTAARVLTGVLEPDEGSALLGEDVVRAGQVGLAYQRPEEQLFASSVWEDVAYGPRNQGLDEDEVASRVERSLEAFGLPREYWHEHAQTLSGGMRRRVALASIVSCAPAAYVLDEPTAGLDDEGCELLHEMVAQLREGGCPVFLVTHDPEQWEAEATRRLDIESAAQIEVRDDSSAGTTRRSRRARRLTWHLPAHDPRFRILSVLAITAGVFFCTSTPAMAAALIASIVLLALSRVDAARLGRSLLPAIPVLALVLLANALRLDGTGDIVLVQMVGLSTAGTKLGVLAVMRILTLILCILSMVAGITTTDVARLVRSVLAPLERLGVRTTDASMALSVTLSMIPQAFDSFNHIAEAQRARGAALYANSLVKRLRAYTAVIAPLIVNLFSCAEALAHAMTLRGFRGEMTMPEQHPTVSDWALLLVSVAVSVLLAWV